MGLDGGNGDEGGKLLIRGRETKVAVMVSESLTDSATSLLTDGNEHESDDSLAVASLRALRLNKRERSGEPKFGPFPTDMRKGDIRFIGVSPMLGENRGLSESACRGVVEVRLPCRTGVLVWIECIAEVSGDDDGKISPEVGDKLISFLREVEATYCVRRGGVHLGVTGLCLLGDELRADVEEESWKSPVCGLRLGGCRRRGARSFGTPS
jgi:hypothetical protein